MERATAQGLLLSAKCSLFWLMSTQYSSNMTPQPIASPSSSLSVMEDFYSEPISEELIRKIRRTPIEQLLDLAKTASTTTVNGLKVTLNIAGSSLLTHCRVAARG